MIDGPASFLTAFQAGLEGAHSSAKSPLEAHANGREFVDKYRLTLDGYAFDWGPMGYQHLVEVYEDEHDRLTMMAGAQTGKTGRLLVKLLRSGIVDWGGLFGYYFPDLWLPRAFSRERFAPFVRSNDQLAPWLGRDATSKKGADQVFSRRFGASMFYFLTTRGKSSTEGLPMKGLFFDEVRRMEAGDLKRAEERTSAQREFTKVKVSTAFLPQQDIHAAFLKGDQRFFHSACRCPDGCVLALTFPDCVVDLSRATPQLLAKVAHAFQHAGMPYLGMTAKERAEYGDAVYLCPKCGEIIVNPRDGWWEQHNPGAYEHSYQMPQLLSPTYPAARAWTKFFQPGQVVDLQQLWNDMVGLPYLDPSAQPVQLSDLMACVDRSLSWPVHQGERWMRENLKNNAMGFDVQQGYNVAVIKGLAPNGKFRTLHVEIVHGEDPWEDCARLMQRFDVRCCIADAQPSWNEAFRFARAFEGRVWLAYYNENPTSEMVDWKDRAKHKPGQKGAEETRFKYTVSINRTKGLDWSLKRWTMRLNEVPDPLKLVQLLPKQGGQVLLSPGLISGTKEPVPVVQDVYFHHQTRVAFLRHYANDEAKKNDQYTIKAEHLGGVDPHFAHANLYCDLALARIGQPAHPRQV